MSTAGQNPVLNHPYVQKAKGLACRYRKPLGAVAVLIVLFGLLGYFWLPGFAKGKVEALLSEKLHRPVTVERIDISPYTLELTVHGFRIGERPEEGEGALFSFDSLYVNLSSMSIARGAPVISAVKLSGPAVRLVRKADGSLSIDDLIEEFSNQPESEPTLFSVSNIEVEKGR
ncbi:MAG: AsmA family protein, partial [Rhodocyclaceae bacterium]|nr:AsmA family protein [Rhodocyclaceae bacterium]